MDQDNNEQRIRDIQHFGEEGGVVPVIDVASTSTFFNPEDMAKTFKGQLEGCYLYSRHSNPTVAAFGKKLAAMEGMESALGVSSGMAAIASTLQQLLSTGGHVLASRTVYGGTYALFKNVLPRWGIEVSFANFNDLAEVEKSIRPNTKVFYTETVGNPLLNVADLKGLSKISKPKGVKLVVDNTFTPLVISPAKLGADVVIYSCTKYISGASDMIAGAIVGSSDFIKELIDVNTGVVMLTGPVMDPRIAHELYLRLDHLPLRMAAHAKSAAYFCNRLANENIKVFYPGLSSHSEHQLFSEMKNNYGFGGMVALDCKSSERANELASRLQQEKFGLYAVSLGFSRTLMSCSAVSTSSEIPGADRETMGLSDGLLRLSIGYLGNDEELTNRFLKIYKSIHA